jgi:hypothetical protein
MHLRTKLGNQMQHQLIHTPTYWTEYQHHIRSAHIYISMAKRLGRQMKCFEWTIEDALWHLQQAKSLRVACAETDNDIRPRLP